jgi:hypothetical protein
LFATCRNTIRPTPPMTWSQRLQGQLEALRAELARLRAAGGLVPASIPTGHHHHFLRPWQRRMLWMTPPLAVVPQVFQAFNGVCQLRPGPGSAYGHGGPHDGNQCASGHATGPIDRHLHAHGVGYHALGRYASCGDQGPLEQGVCGGPRCRLDDTVLARRMRNPGLAQPPPQRGSDDAVTWMPRRARIHCAGCVIYPGPCTIRCRGGAANYRCRTLVGISIGTTTRLYGGLPTLLKRVAVEIYDGARLDVAELCTPFSRLVWWIRRRRTRARTRRP